MIKFIAIVVVLIAAAWAATTVLRRLLEASDLRKVGARHDLRPTDADGWHATRELHQATPRPRLRPAVGGRSGSTQVLVLRWASGRDAEANARREGITVSVRGEHRLASLHLEPRPSAPARRALARVRRRPADFDDAVRSVAPDEATSVAGPTDAVVGDPAFAALVAGRPGVRVRARERELWVEVRGRQVSSRVADELIPFALDLRATAAAAVIRAGG